MSDSVTPALYGIADLHSECSPGASLPAIEIWHCSQMRTVRDEAFTSYLECIEHGTYAAILYKKNLFVSNPISSILPYSKMDVIT